MVAHRGVAVRKRIRRSKGDRTFKKHQCSRHLLRHARIDIRLGSQDKVIGIETVGPFALDPIDFGASQARRDGANDRQCDCILKSEDVIGPVIIALGPNMRSGRRVDQLAGDAHAITYLANTAFEHVMHPEFAANLLHVHHPVFVGEA